MSHSLFRLLVPLGLILVVAGGTVRAAQAPKVNDEARLFSAGALASANETIAEIYRAEQKDLLIETVPLIPQSLETRYRHRGISAFFKEWARKRMEESGVRGIYILICKQPERLQCEIDKATKPRFTFEDRDQLVKRLVPLIKKKNYDAALAEAVATVKTTLESKPARRAGARSPVVAKKDAKAASPAPIVQQAGEQLPPGGEPDSGIPPWTWVIIGLAVFLGLWLLCGVLRAATGTASSYRDDYRGSAGGAGGFFRSLMAGMFGAAAGAWIYDRFPHGDREAGAAMAGEPGAAGSSRSGDGHSGDGAEGGVAFGGAQAESPETQAETPDDGAGQLADDSDGGVGGGDF